MSDNYSQWNITTKELKTGNLESKIRSMLGYGLLAPSGHNGQPWLFQIHGNTVQIYVDEKHALSQSDPQGRQLCLGIGCLLENILLAGQEAGLTVHIGYGDDITGKTPIVTVSVSESSPTTNPNSTLLEAVTKRATDRSRYTLQPVPQRFVEQVTALATEGLTVHVYQEAGLVKQIGELTVYAQLEIMDRAFFRKELSELFVSNISKSVRGMPGFAFGLPTPVSLLAPFLLKHINMSRLDLKKDLETYTTHTPAYLVISTKSETKEAWMKAGQLFEKIWLMAAADSLSCAPNASPIQIENYREKLQTITKNKDYPVVLMRIGFSKNPVRHTPRKSLAVSLK